MRTLLIPPVQWAQQEFGLAELGDERRNKRLVKIASHLAAQPGGTLPQAFPNWAELKAACRFLDQDQVTFQRVLDPHVERTRQQCRQPGEYLLIEDTSLLDYSQQPAAEGLGRIGDGAGRGFELHGALAVRVEAWNLEQQPEGTVVGLFAQQCRTPRRPPAGESPQARLRRPRKSQTWAAALKPVAGPPLAASGFMWRIRNRTFMSPCSFASSTGWIL